MFLRWLFTVFPRELLHGAGLLRTDALLWLMVAFVSAALPAATGGLTMPAGQYATDPQTIVASLAAAVLQLGMVVLLTTKLTGIVEGQEVPLAAAVRAFVKRGAPLLAALMASGCIAMAAFVVTKAAVLLLLRETEYVLEASTAIASVVYVSLVVRYAFVPFLTVHDRYQQLDAAKIASARWPRFLVRVAWPLFASATMTERRAWSLVPYVLLVVLAPASTAYVPDAFRLPALGCQQLAQILLLAVLFYHYVQRRPLVLGQPPS